MAAEHFFYHLFKVFATPFMQRSLEIQVVGRENLPTQGGAILVSNHRSDTDAMLLSLTIPRYISWIVASYMAKVPFTDWLIKRTNAILVNVDGTATPSSLKQAMQVLKKGNFLGIFPEGERYIFANDFAAPLAPLYPGFAYLAVKTQVPVIPIAIAPLSETLEPIHIPRAIQADIAHTQDLKTLQNIVRYQSVRICIGEPIEPEVSAAKHEAIATLMQTTSLAIQQMYKAGAEKINTNVVSLRS